MLGSAMIYAAVLLGPWGALKSAAYRVGTGSWVGYAAAFLVVIFVLLPALFAICTLPFQNRRTFQVNFAKLSSVLIPLGLMFWIAFSLSFVLTNASYILAVDFRPAGNRLESVRDCEYRVAAFADLSRRAGADACPGRRLAVGCANGTANRGEATPLSHACGRVLHGGDSGYAVVIAMKRAEIMSRSLIMVLLFAAVGTPLWIWSRTPLIHAHMAEDGGWTPDTLQAKVGEPLHLQLTSDDVIHGFAVGQMDVQSVDVEPGKVTDVSLTFDKPGTYTFYCTHWCGINHWRMRGTIEVSGGKPAEEIVKPPLYVTLGLDLDAPHEAPVLPGSRPTAGQKVDGNLSISQFTGVDLYRSRSPYQMWKTLRVDASLSGMDDRHIWNLVALIWRSNASSEGIAEGKRLYAQNCAACHGRSRRREWRLRGSAGSNRTKGPVRA